MSILAKLLQNVEAEPINSPPWGSYDRESGEGDRTNAPKTGTWTLSGSTATQPKRSGSRFARADARGMTTTGKSSRFASIEGR
jgi:hypothetical protein